MNTEDAAMRPASDPALAAAALDRPAAKAEMEQAGQGFHRLLCGQATEFLADLRRLDAQLRECHQKLAAAVKPRAPA